MSATTIVDALLDGLDIEVCPDEVECSNIGEISGEKYDQLVEMIEVLLKDEVKN